MANTYTSNWLSVSNGGQTTHDKPASRNVIATEVRWRGVAEQYEDSQRVDAPGELFGLHSVLDKRDVLESLDRRARDEDRPL